MPLLNRLLVLAGIAFPSHGTVLDIGCADGGFGFYLSQEGRAVDFVDFPETNQNQMRMVEQILHIALACHHRRQSTPLGLVLNVKSGSPVRMAP